MARRFTMFLMGVLALAIAFTTHPPAAQDAEGDGCAEGVACDGEEIVDQDVRRSECEQMLGSLKNQSRVAYAKMGEIPNSLTGDFDAGGCRVMATQLQGRHGEVHDKIYSVEDDDERAALIVEETTGEDFGILVFSMLNGLGEVKWYDTLKELKEAHDDVNIDVTEPDPDPEIELMKLYRQAGRKWSHRVVTWQRGVSTSVNFENYRVEEAGDGRATCTFTRRSFGGNPNQEATIDYNVESPSLRYRSWADKGLPVETVATDAGEFECRRHRETIGGIQTTTWVSTEYHPLVVKQVKLGKDFTEIRKLENFYTAEVDPWLLFRKVGRKFTLRSTGDDTEETYIHVTVTRCDADGATVEVLETDENNQPIESGPDGEPIEYEQPRVEEIKFNEEQGMVLYGGGAEAIGGEVETVEVEAGEFGCFVIQNEYGRRSYSRNWIWLPVMLEFPEQDNTDFELVSFDLGHDMREFYGTVGNYYVMESRSEFGGMKTVSTMRYEVVEVLDGEARIKFANFDANGNEVFSQDMEMPVPGLKPPGNSGEDDQGEGEEGKKADGGEEVGEGGDESEAQDEPAPVTPYTGQIEEWITTPAGGFAAIRTEIEMDDMESVTWTWNGLPMRSESHSPDFSSVSEIIELHME